MSLKRQAREREDATFDLTPMIDVVLLLIIFFMLTSQFASSDRAPVNLPGQPGYAASIGAPAELVFDVDEQGTASLAGRPLSIEGFINEAITSNAGALAASKRAGTTGGVRVLLRADQRCPAPALAALCTALSNAGIKAFSLATSGEGTTQGNGG